MPKPGDDLVQEIEQRNAVRREAHLPPLDVAREAAKLTEVERQAAFEAAFEKYVAPISRGWPASDSWMTRMGRAALVRNQFRKLYRPADGEKENILGEYDREG
jgi:hypothetical protein